MARHNKTLGQSASIVKERDPSGAAPQSPQSEAGGSPLPPTPQRKRDTQSVKDWAEIPGFQEVWRHLQGQQGTFQTVQFRRALRNAGLPLWDTHPPELYLEIERRAGELSQDETFARRIVLYYQKAGAGDPIALTRFVCIHALFKALEEKLQTMRT